MDSLPPFALCLFRNWLVPSSKLSASTNFLRAGLLKENTVDLYLSVKVSHVLTASQISALPCPGLIEMSKKRALGRAQQAAAPKSVPVALNHTTYTGLLWSACEVNWRAESWASFLFFWSWGGGETFQLWRLIKAMLVLIRLKLT